MSPALVEGFLDWLTEGGTLPLQWGTTNGSARAYLKGVHVPRSLLEARTSEWLTLHGVPPAPGAVSDFLAAVAARVADDRGSVWPRPSS